MKGILTSFLYIFSAIVFYPTQPQSFNHSVLITFNEWMDTIGFSNPNNFIWTGGLQTIQIEIIDTAKALIIVSQPEVDKWYTLQVSNVYDLHGNLIDPEKDTTGFYYKSDPLPVELTSFTATLNKDIVLLEWITMTEVNNYGFDIERSLNNTEWQNIGFVNGNGNSNSEKSYSFVDDQLTGGSNFRYRLKQIDTDGDYEYSEIVEVEYAPQTFELYQNYPNPFNPTTIIKYQIPKSEFVSIKVFDALGNEVETLVNKEKLAGTYELVFNAKDFSSGIYFYKLQAGDFTATKKMIVIK